MNQASDAIKKTAAFLLVGGVVGFMTYGSLRLAKLDPFSKAKTQTSEAERLSFSLTNIRFTHYQLLRDRDGKPKGGKLVTRAMVDRMDVLKNQQNFKLKGIHNGTYRGEEGQIKFSGETAEWNAARRRLDVTSGAHVVSADFDLKVPRFTFNALQSRITIPGELNGKLGGGDVAAVGFAYNTKTRGWQVGKNSWEGPLALMPQETGKTDKPERWRVTGDSGGGQHDIFTYKNGYAEEMVNGDQIVKADLIEQNRKTKVLTATGHVFYFSTKVNMTCDKAVIYTDDKEKRAVLTGNVNMIVKPKDSQKKAKVEDIPPFRPMVPDSVVVGRPTAPPPGEDEDPTRSAKNVRRFPASILADKIEYWYKKGDRHAIATGSPQAYQELPEGAWRRIWTHIAFYNGEEEMMQMTSTPGTKDTRMRNSTGDDMICTMARVSTKEDDDAWYAEGIKGEVNNDNQDNGGGSGGTKPPPGFERALNIPRMTSPTGSGRSGLAGPIGSGKSPHSKPPSKTKKPKKPH